MNGIRELQDLTLKKTTAYENPHLIFSNLMELLNSKGIEGLESWVKAEVTKCASKVIHNLLKRNRGVGITTADETKQGWLDGIKGVRNVINEKKRLEG